MKYNLYSSSMKLFLAIIFTISIFPQKLIQSTSPEQRMKMYQNHVELKEKSLLNNLQWQFVGPTNISGRMTDLAVATPKGKYYTIYVAGATGGVWKTVNEGITWEPIFEHGPSTSIGALALAPSNQDIVWVGTGESNIFRSSNAGAGVFKSTDAGKTWEHMGLVGTNTISKIIVHPTNPNIVYVAASGNEWTTNKERGLYKSVDGGKNWTNIFYIDEMTGVIDMTMDPKEPNTIYISTWQRVRQKWSDPRTFEDYKGSSIYVTNDEGKNWKEITKGLPAPNKRGRIGIDLALSNTNVIYAFVDNYELIEGSGEGTDAYGRPKKGTIKGATVFRSDDKGNNWRQVSENSSHMQNLSGTYGWVFGKIKVDPTNENKLYIMGILLNVSTDAGKTFKAIGDFHADLHGLFIDPENPNYMVNVNDGGVAISYDDGKTWKDFLNNFPLVQFFNLNVDNSEPFKIYGSIQDHGSYKGTIDMSRGRDKIQPVEFERAPGWEGSIHQIDPTNPDYVYAASFYGSLSRTNMRTNVSKNIMPKAPEGEPALRGQWLAPFIISNFNSKTLYMGFESLFKTTDRGDTWTKISPDLTYNDPKKVGDIPYQTIFSIAESPIKPGLLYVGTDDGRVHTTKDDGKNWKEIVKGLPYGKWVSELVASKYEVNTVYMSQNGKRDDDFMPYLWKSTDNGENWVSIDNNLPTGPINVIKEDPINPNILYVGNDFGVYISFNSGKEWHSLCTNLPTTYVHDLVIHPRENLLLIATHGRGIWAIDISHLQKMDATSFNKDFCLTNYNHGTLPANTRARYIQYNPINFSYLLKNKSEIVFNIINSKGELIKEIKQDASAGLNLASWDLTTNAKERTFVEAGEYFLVNDKFKLKERIVVHKL